MKKERSVLLQTIESLNGEIRQLDSRLRKAQPQSEPEEKTDNNIKFEIPPELDQDIDIDRLSMQTESAGEEMCSNHEDITGQDIQLQNEDLLQDQNHLNDSPINESTESEVDNIKQMQEDRDQNQDKVDIPVLHRHPDALGDLVEPRGPHLVEPWASVELPGVVTQ